MIEEIVTSGEEDTSAAGEQLAASFQPGDGIVAIQWADRWKGRPDDVTEVRIEYVGEDGRVVRIVNSVAGGCGWDRG